MDALSRAGLYFLPFTLMMIMALAMGTTVVAMAQEDDTYREERQALVEKIKVQLAELRAQSELSAPTEAVLEAIAEVPRHAFVPAHLAKKAYRNRPLPIGHAQTISQPLIVALMSALAEVDKTEKVLEVGTGSGYQAAVLGLLAGEVYSVEIIEPLGLQAAKKLRELGYDNVHTRIGDGHAGWPEHAPYDAIVVTAAPDHIPNALVEQLKTGGRLVIPVGDFDQELVVVEKLADGTTRKREVIPVRFVPLTRHAE